MQWRRLIALTFKLFSNGFILDLTNVYCAPKFRNFFSSFFIILKLRFLLRLYLSFCIGLNHLFIILAQCFDRELWINNFNIWKHHFQNRIFFIDKRKKTENNFQSIKIFFSPHKQFQSQTFQSKNMDRIRWINIYYKKSKRWRKFRKVIHIDVLLC